MTQSSDSLPVDVRVHLPREVAQQVEEIQKNRPEMLSRILVYGLTRQVIFDTLARRHSAVGKQES